MSFNQRNEDYFQYGRIYLMDTYHNRLSAIASETIISTARRNNLQTNRSVHTFARFVIDSLNQFRVLSEDPCADILDMWLTAGVLPTGSEQEFMITVLAEIHSSFNAQIMDLAPRLKDYLKALYPQLSADPIANPSGNLSEEEEGFNRSYVFTIVPVQQMVERLLRPEYSWALPWMILAHADSLVIDQLISGVSIGGVQGDDNP